MLQDSMVVVSPDGKIEAEYNLMDLLLEEELRHFISGSPHHHPAPDLLHVNTVDYITPEFASHNPWATEGSFLLLARDLDLAFQVDPELNEVTWAERLPFIRPHDTDPLPNGNLMILDNRGNLTEGGRSRIVEWDPETGIVSWMYRGTEDNPFETEIRGVQQPLPNGNVLITSSDQARLFEVTREGEVVWQFRSPVRLKVVDYPEQWPILSGGRRYTADQAAFLFPDEE